MSDDLLPSWRPGATRTSLLAFLDAARDLPADRRVAVFDNDGTLWCEKPEYPQLAFFLEALSEAVRADPRVGHRPEFLALMTGDEVAMAEIGMERIALALAGLFAGIEPKEFADRARVWIHGTAHPTLARPMAATTYLPMVELIDELRRRAFAVFVCTGGGTEFVRAVATELYGVPPEGVVGSLVTYEFVPRGGRPVLVRGDGIQGSANEGPAKVVNIQQLLGRRPVFAAGNSAGDREMLEDALAGDGPRLALLVDHDDDEREFAYESRAGTFEEAEPILDVARHQGWTVASMAQDWSRVFSEDG